MKRHFALIVWVSATLSAEKVATEKLIEMAKGPRPADFEQTVIDTLGAEAVQKGTAVAGVGSDFLFAIESEKEPLLALNNTAPFHMYKLGKLWTYSGQLMTGRSHRFHYLIDGKSFGGRNDVAAFTPDSYDQAGVPKGKIVGPVVHKSKIYEGMETNYWLHVPAQYEGATPAAVLVFNDGEKYAGYDKTPRLVQAIDNLTAQKKIPVMISVLISPGKIGARAMRSVEYDTVTDTYARYLLEEILPEVAKDYKLRTDGYSRAIAGESSGGVCSFTAAWFKPDQFARVISRIGTYTSIQWKPNGDGKGSTLDGGNIYPFAVRKQPRRNVRIWMEDGAEDLENTHGSWPLQNIQLANSLKMREYDHLFRWSLGTHSTANGNARLPEALMWIWRDYDPAKTSQEFVMDPAEKSKPYWRVVQLNRE